jgi:hypothetical protein
MIGQNETELRDAISTRIDTLESRVAENTALTQEIKADTAEFLAIFRSMRGGAEVLVWVGGLVKWAAGIGAAVAAVYFAFKNGPPQ